MLEKTTLEKFDMTDQEQQGAKTPPRVPPSNADELAEALGAALFASEPLAVIVSAASMGAAALLTERQQVQRVRLALLEAVDALWPDIGTLNAAYVRQLGVIDELQRWLDSDNAAAAAEVRP